MGAVPGTELRDDPLAVALDRLRREEESLAGLRRGLALGGRRQDLRLPVRERLSFEDLGEQARHAARFLTRVEPF
jgi:hypothetical protein